MATGEWANLWIQGFQLKPRRAASVMVGLLALLVLGVFSSSWAFESESLELFWRPSRHGENPMGGTSTPVPFHKDEGTAYVSLTDFCKVAQCRLTYHPEKHRALVENPKSKSVLVLSHHANRVLIRDKVRTLLHPVHWIPSKGYSVSWQDLESWLGELDLGVLYKKANERSLYSYGDEGSAFQALKTIVIDPGHGGQDQGTKKGMLFEKDIALFYAKGLAEALKKRLPDLKVILTREDDSYVSLAERAKLANRSGAQLFVSLHVNHGDDIKVGGIETFVLSPDATDRESKQTALLENQGWIEKAGIPKSKDDGAVGRILVDLEQQRFIQKSALMAAYVQQEFSSKDTFLKNRGAKQAFFYVLSQVAMPSILIELGFLSNTEDREKLMHAAFREKLLQSLVRAVERYRMTSLRSSGT